MARLRLPGQCSGRRRRWGSLPLTRNLQPGRDHITGRRNGRSWGRLDNRVKPILDGMSGCVYADDQQIERLVVQKFEPGRVYAFASPSACLAAALGADGPVVYIRITDQLFEELS